MPETANDELAQILEVAMEHAIEAALAQPRAPDRFDRWFKIIALVTTALMLPLVAFAWNTSRENDRVNAKQDQALALLAEIPAMVREHARLLGSHETALASSAADRWSSKDQAVHEANASQQLLEVWQAIADLKADVRANSEALKRPGA